MAFSRYSRTPVIRMGEHYGTPTNINVIRSAIRQGRIKTREIEVHESQRLDTLAGAVYGDGRYWWILAATSDIGWGLQVPPGTIVKIPELEDISELIG